LLGGRSSYSGMAARRTFSASQAPGAIGRRTEPPAATPDVAVFGNRRSPGIQDRAVPGGNALAAFDNRARAREVPGATRPAGPPLTSQPDVARQRRARMESNPPAPSVSPRAYDTPSQAPIRRNLPFGNSGGMPDSSSRPAAPRSYETPAPAPRSAPPRQSSPAWQGSRPAQPVAPARGRDSGSGVPAGQAYRQGSSPAGSAPSGPPRYNPGAAGSQPRGGSHSPPPRGRGGTPD